MSKQSQAEKYQIDFFVTFCNDFGLNIFFKPVF